MGARTITTLALIYAGLSVLGIAAGATIVRKAGYSPWWIVTGLIPLVNVVMAFAFAFADWPVLQEGRRARRLQAAEPRGHPSFSVVPPVTLAFAPAASGLAPLPLAAVDHPARPVDPSPPMVAYDPAAAVPSAPASNVPPVYPQHRRHGA
jgi:hypothetical protein